MLPVAGALSPRSACSTRGSHRSMVGDPPPRRRDAGDSNAQAAVVLARGLEWFRHFTYTGITWKSPEDGLVAEVRSLKCGDSGVPGAGEDSEITASMLIVSRDSRLAVRVVPGWRATPGC